MYRYIFIFVCVECIICMLYSYGQKHELRSSHSQPLLPSSQPLLQHSRSTTNIRVASSSKSPTKRHMKKEKARYTVPEHHLVSPNHSNSPTTPFTDSYFATNSPNRDILSTSASATSRHHSPIPRTGRRELKYPTGGSTNSPQNQKNTGKHKISERSHLDDVDRAHRLISYSKRQAKSIEQQFSDELPSSQLPDNAYIYEGLGLACEGLDTKPIFPVPIPSNRNQITLLSHLLTESVNLYILPPLGGESHSQASLLATYNRLPMATVGKLIRYS